MSENQSIPAFDFIVDKIAIAAPCKASWENMTGDDTKRFCGDCSKDVYNLSAMSKPEAEAFLQKANQIPCLKFYRRLDGTIIFDNCPKGLRRIRDAAKSLIKVTSVATAFLFSAVACLAKDDKPIPPARFNVVWTLSESGPTVADNNPHPPAKLQSVDKPGQLAQIGSVDHNGLFRQLFSTTPQTKGFGADWEGADAFSRALTLVEAKKYSAAQRAFNDALSACSKPGYDPMYKEFIGIEYAKLLTKLGQSEKAKAIRVETKMPQCKP